MLLALDLAFINAMLARWISSPISSASSLFMGNDSGGCAMAVCVSVAPIRCSLLLNDEFISIFEWPKKYSSPSSRSAYGWHINGLIDDVPGVVDVFPYATWSCCDAEYCDHSMWFMKDEETPELLKFPKHFPCKINKSIYECWCTLVKRITLHTAT